MARDIHADIEATKRRHPELFETTEKEDEVLARYGPVFDIANLDALTAEKFKSFLLIRNNRHWDGIHRHCNAITEDMDALRKTLAFLLDETIPIAERLNDICDGGPHAIRGLGRAVVTPILLVAYPTKYAVLNSKVQRVLEKHGMFPDADSFGDLYVRVNEIVNDLAHHHDLTLFQVDHVFHCLLQPDVEEAEEPVALPEVEFGLEKYLEDFLVTNWENCGLYPEWELYEDDDEVVGRQYVTGEVGTIDLLARRREGEERTDWLVIELKRGRSGDAAVGQVMRYIGWVRRNLVEGDEDVRGLIITQEADISLRYAVSELPHVDLKTYSVRFTLDDVPDVE